MKRKVRALLAGLVLLGLAAGVVSELVASEKTPPISRYRTGRNSNDFVDGTGRPVGTQEYLSVPYTTDPSAIGNVQRFIPWWTINGIDYGYWARWTQVSCVRGTAVVRPFGPMFSTVTDGSQSIVISSAADSVFQWSTSFKVDSLWIHSNTGTASRVFVVCF